MKCSICNEKISECDGCKEVFIKGKKIICEMAWGNHYCERNCIPNLEEGLINED